MENDYVGKSMRELSKDELKSIYGTQYIGNEAAGLSAAISEVASKTLTTSKSTKACISAASISAISGLISYNFDCLG